MLMRRRERDISSLSGLFLCQIKPIMYSCATVVHISDDGDSCYC